MHLMLRWFAWKEGFLGWVWVGIGLGFGWVGAGLVCLGVAVGPGELQFPQMANRTENS